MAPKFQINLACTFVKSSEITDEEMKAITNCGDNEVPAINIYEILLQFTDNFRDNQLRACKRSKGGNWTISFPYKIEGKFLDKINEKEAKTKNKEIKDGISEEEKLKILIENYSRNINDALKRAKLFNDEENEIERLKKQLAAAEERGKNS